MQFDCSISILGPPRILNKADPVLAVLDQKLDIPCLSGGAEPLHIYWKRNGDDIVNSTSEKGTAFIRYNVKHQQPIWLPIAHGYYSKLNQISFVNKTQTKFASLCPNTSSSFLCYSGSIPMARSLYLM